MTDRSRFSGPCPSASAWPLKSPCRRGRKQRWTVIFTVTAYARPLARDQTCYYEVRLVTPGATWPDTTRSPGLRVDLCRRVRVIGPHAMPAIHHCSTATGGNPVALAGVVARKGAVCIEAIAGR